ncbi:hypothetical protein [Streptomyces sp. NPDC001536]|uniref:hypothetical protein n=1 Tax=Streptomyces sp. NPDC001536 TaxID=3364583 RepID=UPI0036B0B766
MSWFTMISTLLGTALGITSTLFTERIRARDVVKRERAIVVMDAYVAFITAMHHAKGNIRTVALEIERIDESERGAKARQAFRGSGVYETLERLILLAPEGVVHAANSLFLILRDHRYIVANGNNPNSELYRQNSARYAEALHNLRSLVREDIGLESFNQNVPF